MFKAWLFPVYRECDLIIDITRGDDFNGLRIEGSDLDLGVSTVQV